MTERTYIGILCLAIAVVVTILTVTFIHAARGETAVPPSPKYNIVLSIETQEGEKVGLVFGHTDSGIVTFDTKEACEEVLFSDPGLYQAVRRTLLIVEQKHAKVLNFGCMPAEEPGQKI